MATRPIDFVIMVDNAYYCKRTKSLQECSDLAAKLLSDGYCGFNQWGNVTAYQAGKENADTMFKYLQNIIIFSFFNDNTVRQSEYNAYVKWCSNAGYRAMTPSELTTQRNSLPYQKFLDAYDLLLGLRHRIDSAYYHNFVYGLVLMAVVSEGSFTKWSYDLYKRLLTPGYDNCPDYNSLMNQVYP